MRKTTTGLMGVIGAFTLIASLIMGSGTAGAAVSDAGKIKSVEAEMKTLLEEQMPMTGVVTASQSGSKYSCPLIALTCTLYVSYSRTVDIHNAIKGAGPTAAATTVGKVICSLIPPLKPFSAGCGVLVAARMGQIQDQAAYAVRRQRCLEVKTTKPMPVSIPPGNPPVTIISIGTWDTGDSGTGGRVCK